MSFVAVAVGGTVAGVAGSVIQANAAEDAADKQLEAVDKSNALQEKIYNQTREDIQPWREAGVNALSQLSNADFQRDFTVNDFKQDPGYDFRLKEGQKALERSAAARGGLQSGGTLKNIARYAQDYASNEYQNAYNRFNADRDRRFNRLSSVAGVGQTASTNLSNAGMNYANQMGQNYMGAANAAGASRIAQGNAIAGGLNNIGQTWMDYSMMNMFGGK